MLTGLVRDSGYQNVGAFVVVLYFFLGNPRHYNCAKKCEIASCYT